MTTTSNGSGDDASAEESMISVVASAPSQESDEELGSEPSSQATKEVEGPSGEHVAAGVETSQDEEAIDVTKTKPAMNPLWMSEDRTEKVHHPDAAEPSAAHAVVVASSPFFSPPRPRKRGRALLPPSSSSAAAPRTSSSSRKSQKRNSKEFSSDALSDFSDAFHNEDEDAAEAFLSSSSNLAYSWDALFGLGHGNLGSAALNRYMARFNNNNEKNKSPMLTAQQTLQIVNSLQLRTIMPPEFSALHGIIQRNPLENQQFLYGSHDDEDQDEFSSPDDNNNNASFLPFKTLARLYETMCEQDVDDGSFNRREVQYWTAGECLERLMAFENTACALRKREEDVLKKTNELLQWMDDDNTHAQAVSAMLGYHTTNSPDSK